MKKFLIVFFYTFIFVFYNFTFIETDNLVTNEKSLVESKIEYSTANIENDLKEEIIEEEEEEVENSDIIQTSTTDEYTETDDSYDESYYINYGTFGRLYLPGYSVALYDYNVNTYSSYSLQDIVNDYDSAAFYLNKGKLVIADHNYQGFSILTSLTEGTTSYIQFEDGSTIGYRLIKKSEGYNTGPDLVDTEGNSFFYMESDIIMYTCYDDGIMATLWVLN